MTQPTAYTRQATFTSLGETFSNFANALENEYNAVKTTIDETLANIALMQKDDTTFINASITLDNLAADTLVLIGGSTSGWTFQGDWVTATAYVLGDVVKETTNTYVCSEAHTSGTFATDDTAAKWTLIALGASSVPNDGVTTAKLLDGAVTTAKIAASAVTSAKIATDTITAANIASGAVGQSELAVNSVDITEMAGQSAGEMLSYDSAGDPVIVSAGTAFQVLVATAGQEPAFDGHGGDWGDVLLSSVLASPAASLGVSFTPAFPITLFCYEEIKVDTDGVDLYLTLSTDSGSSYISSGYSYHVQDVASSSPSYVAIASTSDSEIELVNAMGSATTESAEVYVFLSNLDGDGSRHVNISGWCVFRDVNDQVQGGMFIAGCDSTSDISAVKLAASSGNMETGSRVQMFGLGRGI